MKRTASLSTVSVILCLLMTLTLSAYSTLPADLSAHIPRDGDKLHPNVSFLKGAISGVDTADRVASFSTGMFSPSDEADVSVYVDRDTLSYIQFATKYLFRLSSDTLSLIGYENRASEFRIDNPSETITLESAGKNQIVTAWTGRQTIHGRDFLKSAMGMSRCSAEEGWALVADTDTLRNVTYMTWDFDMAYFDSDSIAADVPDSIASESISDLRLPVSEMASERILTRREMWLVKEARYPVLQRSRSFRLKENVDGNCDTIPLITFAMHYPPSFQYSDTGEELVKKAPGQNFHGAGIANGYGDDVWEDGKINVSEATVGGGSVSVTVSGVAGEGDARLAIYTDSGIRLTEPKTVKVGAIPQTYSIALPENSSGVLIIMIETDSGNISRKVIL